MSDTGAGVADTGAAAVARRRVLFVHGYDPRGPAPYHALMAEEAQPGLLNVGPRQGAAWTVSVDWPEGRAESRVEVLRWDDLVRAHWVRGARAGQLPWRFLRAYLRAGVIAAAVRDNRPLLAAMVLPSLVVALHAMLMVGLTALAILAIAALATRLGGSAAWGMAGLAGLAAWSPLWRVMQARLDLDWLSQCFDALARFRDMPPDREAKLDALAARIVEAAAESQDQHIVVVGHSIGTLMAAGAVSRALALSPGLERQARLVTLGHCLSVYARLGGDVGWRRDLARLVASDIPWTDVTSPADGASAGRWGPMKFSDHEVAAERVQARSPRFHEALDPARMSRLRRDPRALHFQYLRLSDRPEIYDIRRLIAGPGEAAP